MTLRKYQAESIKETLAALERSGSAVLQMPTGAGKTKTAMEIVAGHDGVVWFLCHRKEIIRQAAKAFRAAGIDFGVISPAKDPETGKKYEFQPEKRVQIASVGSIGRRIGKLPVPSLVIWDECHHTPAASWRDIRDRTQAAKHIGLTATPERQDGAGLRELFDEMIVGPSIKELVDDGWLSRFRYFTPSEPDLSAARMQAGDYRKGDIEKVMNTPVLIGDAVSEYKKSIPGKRALVFAVSVDASRSLAEKFREEGIAAAHVDANTPDDERDAAVADLADGKIKVLSNVEVFTEGFDIPAIDAVILMRPTRSVRLLLQMIGRALRIAEGKDCAMLFDHAGLYHEHGWFADDWCWSLDGGAAKERRKALERGPRKCPECKEVRAEREPICACGFEFPSGREIGEFDGVLREIRGEVPEGCENKTDFARRVGFTKVAIGKWILKGLPNVYGHPLVEDGIDWISNNVSVKRDGSMSLEAFGKMRGTTGSTVRRWRDKGMPTSNGRPILGISDKWVDALEYVPKGCTTKAALAKEMSVSKSTVARWIRRGLPSVDGHPLKIEVSAWLRKNNEIPLGHEKQIHFADRISVPRHNMAYWVKSGLPYDPKLGIPIREALEWVRDNRPDIVIPPEAWPAADNDNTASTKAA